MAKKKLEIPLKLTFRLGELREPLQAKLSESGEKPSAYLRRLVAADLGEEPPAMEGRVENMRRVGKQRLAKNDHGSCE